MMKFIVRIFQIFVLILTILSVVNIYAENLKILLCYPDNDTSPLQIGDGDAVFNPPGLNIDIINAAVKKLNIDVRYVREPVSRIFDSLKNNKIDGAFVFSYSGERAKVAVYPQKNNIILENLRVVSLSNYFYTNLNSNIQWKNSKLINNELNIGVLRGHAIIEFLKKNKIPYEESSTLEMLTKKLQYKRISAFIGQSIIVEHYLKENKITNIKRLPEVISMKNYFLIFSKDFYKKNNKQANDLWNTISKVRELEIKKFVR